MTADPLASLTALDGVPSAFASARDGVDAMLRDRGLRRTSPELTAEALLRGAWASAVLEGSACSMDDLRAGDMDEVARSSVRVSAELLSLVPTVRRAPIQAFARIHTLAGLGAAPDDTLGKPRNAEAAEGLRTLADRLLRPTTAPAMLVAAVAHADLATAAPFASHNGIVARAVERLLLVARGVDEKSLLVPEEGHRLFRAEYESNLRAYASAPGVSGVHAWLLYAAEAYAKGAEASPVRG